MKTKQNIVGKLKALRPKRITYMEHYARINKLARFLLDNKKYEELETLMAVLSDDERTGMIMAEGMGMVMKWMFEHQDEMKKMVEDVKKESKKKKPV